MKSICRMSGCNREADGSLGFCKACYSFAYYWRKKSLKHVMARIDKLGVATTRMGTLMPARVTSIKKRRKVR